MPSTFQFEPYRSDAPRTIADIMLRSGDQQAAALRASGEMKARAAAQIGSEAAGTISAIQQERRDAPIRALQIHNLQNQTTEGDLQIQAHKRALMGSQVLAMAIKQYGDNPEQVGKFLVANGFNDVADGYVKTQDLLSSLRKGDIADQDAAHAFEGEALKRVIGITDADPAVQQQKRQAAWTALQGGLKAHLGKHYDEAGLSPTWDDAQAQQQVALYGAKPEPFIIHEGDIVGDKGNLSGPPLAVGAPKPKDEWQSFQAAYAKKAGSAEWGTLSPDQQMAGFTQFTLAKQDPAMHELMKDNAQVRNLLMQAQLGQQPTADDAKLIAQQILDRKMAPSQLTLFGGMGSQGAAFKRMVGTAALKLDKEFNWEEAESTYQLAKSPSFQNTVRYMDSVRESMPRLQQTADALNNSKVRFVNGLANLSKDQLNDPTLKAFQTDVLLVGDEVAKILQGGGTGSATSDAKLAQAGKILSTSDSPASIKSALSEVHALIGFRRKALTRGTYMDQPETAAPTNPDYGYGNRYNSTTPKGLGFLGPLQRSDGGVMSEYSVGVQIGGKETEIPALVPTLTKAEVAHILSMKPGDKLPDAIVLKARKYAEGRIAAGKDPFAAPGEQQALYPDLKRAPTPTSSAPITVGGFTVKVK